MAHGEPAQMSGPVCRLCGSGAVDPWAEGTDQKFGGAGRFSYRQCRECRLVFLHPPLSTRQLARYYPDHVTPVVRPGEGPRMQRIRQWLKHAVADEWYGYAKRPGFHGSPWKRLVRTAIGWPLRPLLAQVPPYRAGGRVLDVGCGSGGYLAFLSGLGWRCDGVETGEKSRTYARTVLGLDVRNGPLESCRYPDASFDVVTLWHVIEHLPDPAGTLREIRRILKPDGQLYLRTPNVQSWEAVWFRGHWYGLDPPRHLCLFSPETLERALRESGFSVTRMNNNYHVVDCSRSVLYGLRTRALDGPARLLAATMFAWEGLLTVLMPVRRLLGRGGAVHVEACKAGADA
jgi:2-polyprenyl-3-methyl-5-hydroxy-6-metoxy-1,4-benzoquinol methylase